MKSWRTIALSLALATPAVAAADVFPIKAARLRFGHVASRAVANFRSADSIERNLRAHGSTLHPALAALRTRIESALDDAEEALANGDAAETEDSARRAEALLDKFAAAIGGA